MPKPAIETYKRLIDKYKIEPQYCIFIEDIARNLKPAHELGMKTVWIKNNEPWAAKYSNENFVNYRTANLTNFLKEINELRKKLKKLLTKLLKIKKKLIVQINH